MAKRLQIQDLILVDTPDYLVVNKPSNVSTLEDRNDPYNMLSLVKSINENVQVCHRLDKETSGALVFSKNEDAYRNMAMQFEARQVEKVYHAVTQGVHDIEGIKIDVHLTKKGIVHVDKFGKPAETMVKTAEIFKGYTLLHCKPVTGRTHQIRVHLAYIGAPIVHDSTYGGAPIFLSQIKRKFNLKKGEEEQPLIKRIALHAAEITFCDMQGEPMTVSAPYPKDYEVLVKQLRKNAR